MLSQVALNDTILVFTFAPIVALLLGLSSIVVHRDTLITSVVLYIVIPVVIAQLERQVLLLYGQAAFDRALVTIAPWSIAALLATLVLLFAFQDKAIIEHPLVIATLAVPIMFQVFFNSGLAYRLNRPLRESHDVACPSALIGDRHERRQQQYLSEPGLQHVAQHLRAAPTCPSLAIPLFDVDVDQAQAGANRTS